MYHYHGYMHHHTWHPWMMQYYHHWPYPYGCAPVCNTCHMPVVYCTCEQKMRVVLPQELTVDPETSPQEALIGGLNEVQPTLEYMAEDGATSAMVKVTITGADGSSSSWEETSIAPGYHVKNDFNKIAPGSKIAVEVSEAVARLRWCEFTEC